MYRGCVLVKESEVNTLQKELGKDFWENLNVILEVVPDEMFDGYINVTKKLESARETFNEIRKEFL